MLFFSLIFSSFWLAAQITVTDATFPVTGDTLKTATDLVPSGIEITNAGGPFDWDFTSLNVGTQSESVFLDASEGDAFDEAPNATHVVINEFDVTESYFKISSSKVELIGASGNDPTGFGIGAFLKFTPPIIQRRAPMNFIDNNLSESDVRLALAWDDLPTVLTDSLGFALADSIAVAVNSTRNDLVDAYGTLAIPGGTYEVLREKRTEFRETRIEVLVPFLGWIDVTNQIGDFGMETIITYQYFSNTEKEVIASVTVDADDLPISVTFKDNGILTANEEVLSARPFVQINPNPINEIANFEFSNIPDGEYQLVINGLNGNMVAHRQFQLSSYQVEQIILSHLSKGTYFFSLKDNSGNMVSGGKLIKL